MRALTALELAELKKRTDAGTPLAEVIPAVLGGATLDHGFWRFFYPDGVGMLSMAKWNSPNVWKHAWSGLASTTFWGEDVFGNQIILDGGGSVFLWNHENAAAIETGFDLHTVLETGLKHGLAWLDFYSDGSHALVGEQKRELSTDRHWHWIQPRILGGAIAAGNLTSIERVQHLVGHAKLWLQVSAIGGSGPRR
jgi:hypothetical protein